MCFIFSFVSTQQGEIILLHGFPLATQLSPSFPIEISKCIFYLDPADGTPIPNYPSP